MTLLLPDILARTDYNAATSTTSRTLTAGTNLLVVPHVNRDNDDCLSGATYNGVALSRLSTPQVDTGGGTGKAQMWYLLNPTTGSAQNLVLTQQNPTHPSSYIVLGFSGVDPVTPFGTVVQSGSNTTTPTGTVVAAVGDIVIDVVYFFQNTTPGQNSATPGSGQTADANAAYTGQVNVSGYPFMLASHEAGAASVVMDWTLPVAHFWASVAVAVKAAAAVTASGGKMMMYGVGAA